MPYPSIYGQPMYQPIYQQQYQPQQMPQLQQMQIPKLSGRSVNSADEIVANEVAMDGSVSWFPKSDLSEVYAKQWKADGTIQTVVYKPETTSVTADKPQINSQIEELINSRFEALEAKIDKVLNKERGNKP